VRLELICAGEILSLSRPICLLLFLLVDADEQLDENPALNLQILLYTDCYIRRVSVLTANFWRCTSDKYPVHDHTFTFGMSFYILPSFLFLRMYILHSTVADLQLVYDHPPFAVYHDIIPGNYWRVHMVAMWCSGPPVFPFVFL
jgi:hypothetical protein